jgi:hypothetical protein
MRCSVPGLLADTVADHRRRVDVVRRFDCGHGVHAVAAVQRLASELQIRIGVRDVVIGTDDEARTTGCLGSPTVLVGGVDVEPAARGRTSFGVT